jgi:glutamate dehydrogenase
MMENMGLRVLSEHPYEMALGAGSRIFIQDFEVQPQAGIAVDPDVARQLPGGVRTHLARRRRERRLQPPDPFGAADWRQVAMLRGYCKYLLQTGVPFSQTTWKTLARYPQIARLLAELFEAKFDPARDNHDEVRNLDIAAETARRR